jgi:uncharacterized membrane protein YkvA (DUF1232 family)
MGLEDFNDTSAPAERPVSPAGQPTWARAVAWLTVVLGGIYLINPTAGIFELLPDNLPVVGNLDEAAVVLVMLAAMRYLGVHLPEFIEQWTRQSPGLPSTLDQDEQ